MWTTTEVKFKKPPKPILVVTVPIKSWETDEQKKKVLKRAKKELAIPGYHCIFHPSESTNEYSFTVLK